MKIKAKKNLLYGTRIIRAGEYVEVAEIGKLKGEQFELPAQVEQSTFEEQPLPPLGKKK